MKGKMTVRHSALKTVKMMTSEQQETMTTVVLVVSLVLEAIQYYTDYLTIDSSDYQVLSNRSTAYLAIGYVEEAYQDARKCLQLSGNRWMKGYYRLGNVLERLEKWNEAADAFRSGLALDEQNKEMINKLEKMERKAKDEAVQWSTQLAMYRRDAVFRLKRARQADAKNALIAQYKESMTCPDWEPEEYEWRPTFLPMKTVKSTKPFTVEEDTYDKMLVPFLKTLSDLAMPKECFGILKDSNWFRFYNKELRCAIESRPGCHVVAIGYWSCLLGIIAARHGARKVTCIEQSQTMYKLTTSILDINKGSLNPLCSINVPPVDVYHCFASSSDCEQDKKTIYVEEADILVSDLFDHCALGYGFFRVLDHSRQSILKKDCLVIPSAIEISAAIVDSTLSSVCGFNFECLSKYQWYFDHQRIPGRKGHIHNQLTEVITLLHINFQERVDLGANSAKHTVQAKIDKSGVVSGVLTGFKLIGSTDSEHTLSSWTRDPSSQNMMAAQPSRFSLGLQHLDNLSVNEGETLDLQVYLDDSLFRVSLVGNHCTPRHALLPEWHFDMLRDDIRNTSYKIAIEKAVEFKKASGISKVHVLDAGAGSGLLSLIAARSGSAKVSAIEFPGHVADLCEENVLMNGFFSKITVIPKAIKMVSFEELEGKADIVTMEVFDCGLIGEGALHTIKTAVENLSKEDVILIPCGAKVYAQPIQLDRAETLLDFNVSSINALRWRPEYEEIHLNDREHDFVALAPPTQVFSFDFYEIENCLENNSIDFYLQITDTGVLNAVVFWFDLFLDDENKLSTSPYETSIKSTWGQAVQWIKETAVQEGDQLHLQATHDTHGFQFKVLNDDLEGTGIPLVDPSWKMTYDKIQLVNRAMMKDISENPKEYRKICNKALQYSKPLLSQHWS